MPLWRLNHLIDQLREAGDGHCLTDLSRKSFERLRTVRGDIVREEDIFFFNTVPCLKIVLVLQLRHHDTQGGEESCFHVLLVILE